MLLMEEKGLLMGKDRLRGRRKDNARRLDAERAEDDWLSSRCWCLSLGVKDGIDSEERCWRRSRRLRKGWGAEGCRVGTAKGLEERRDGRCGGRRAGGRRRLGVESRVSETIISTSTDDLGTPTEKRREGDFSSQGRDFSATRSTEDRKVEDEGRGRGGGGRKPGWVGCEQKKGKHAHLETANEPF